MKHLLYKEWRLAMHPTALLFLPLSAMLLIPNYPYYVIFFYTSLGHHDDVFDKSPSAEVLMERGMLWAAGGKQFAMENSLDATKYKNNAKMY